MSPTPPLFASRREFLRTGLVGGSLAATVPGFLGATMQTLHAAQDGKATQGITGRDGNILVVLQLAGGNDGLNTVVPVENDHYHQARSALALRRKDCLALADGLGLHPALTGFKSLFDNGRLSIVQGVGYPNPNRSHFRSMEIWHTASDAEKTEKFGWVGRYFDNACSGAPPEVGVSLGGVAPQAFTSAAGRGVTFQDPERFRYRGGGSEAEDEFYAMMNRDGDNDGGSIAMASGRASTVTVADPLDFLERVAMDTGVASERIQQVLKKPAGAASFPQNRLAADLRIVSRLIAGGLGTRVYYVSHGGFDTHTNQAQTHERLLGELGGAVKAFLDDLEKQGNLGRVTVMVFSEFGRRLKENASGGTDHGAAAPMFLAGAGIIPGVHGTAPSLAARDLDQGDLRHTVDFRRVYATIIERVLHADPKAVLGREYEPMNLFQAPVART